MYFDGEYVAEIENIIGERFQVSVECGATEIIDAYVKSMKLAKEIAGFVLAGRNQVKVKKLTDGGVIYFAGEEVFLQSSTYYSIMFFPWKMLSQVTKCKTEKEVINLWWYHCGTQA